MEPTVHPGPSVEPRIKVESIEVRLGAWGEAEQVCTGHVGDRTIRIVVPAPIPVIPGDMLEYLPTYRSPNRWATVYVINGTRHLYVIDGEV